jgi:hypothetical protein
MELQNDWAGIHKMAFYPRILPGPDKRVGDGRIRTNQPGRFDALGAIRMRFDEYGPAWGKINQAHAFYNRVWTGHQDL